MWQAYNVTQHYLTEVKNYQAHRKHKTQESALHSPPCDFLSEEDLSDTETVLSLTYQGLNFSPEISKKSKTSVNNISEYK